MEGSGGGLGGCGEYSMVEWTRGCVRRRAGGAVMGACRVRVSCDLPPRPLLCRMRCERRSSASETAPETRESACVEACAPHVRGESAASVSESVRACRVSACAHMLRASARCLCPPSVATRCMSIVGAWRRAGEGGRVRVHDEKANATHPQHSWSTLAAPRPHRSQGAPAA